MQFVQYIDVNAFYAATRDTLMLHEAQNVIPLGNALIGVRGEDKTGWRDPANWFMCTVSDSSGILLTAIMTPPHNLALYATNNRNNPETITCLIEGLVSAGVTIPGILAEKSHAEMFTSIYTTRHHVTAKIKMSQRIYELTEVNPAIKKAPLRLAHERDLSFLPYWNEHFFHEGEDKTFAISNDIEANRYLIRMGRTYIMENAGIPVSMARIPRDTETVCVLGGVYTPPYFRNRGYATATTAALSQIGLNKGYKKIVLYTDLNKPTPNSIYQKIGYKAIGDSLMMGFESPYNP